jgi:hypothetical protein
MYLIKNQGNFIFHSVMLGSSWTAGSLSVYKFYSRTQLQMHNLINIDFYIILINKFRFTYSLPMSQDFSTKVLCPISDITMRPVYRGHVNLLHLISISTIHNERLRWSSGTRVRGFKPGRSRRIFSGEKILSSKAVCPMSQICGM